MKKEQIIQELNEKYDALISWLKAHDDDKFEVSERPGKWTTGQHAEHLIKSSAPLNQALKMPLLVLRTTFGTNNREERNFEQLQERYQEKLKDLDPTRMAASRFAPKTVTRAEKARILETLDEERYTLIKNLEKWREKDLSKYIIPHPLLGKITVREMMMFTVFHIGIHLDILRAFY